MLLAWFKMGLRPILYHDVRYGLRFLFSIRLEITQ